MVRWNGCYLLQKYTVRMKPNLRYATEIFPTVCFEVTVPAIWLCCGAFWENTMCKSKDGRTTTERKYQPIRRDVSRYGKLEKILQDMKREGHKLDPQVVAHRIKILSTMQVASLLQFTQGVERGEKKGVWIFTGDNIRVQNSAGAS